VSTLNLAARAAARRQYAIRNYLEDGAAIQIGFMQLIHGVAQQRLEQWRARMILSALHGAAANLRQMDAATASCEKVAKKTPKSVSVSGNKNEESA
jgi:hypothetical protein